MKICQVGIVTEYTHTKRLALFISEDEIVDPNRVYQLYFEKKGFCLNSERAYTQCPPKLSKLLMTQAEPLAILQEALNLYQKYKKTGDLHLKNGKKIYYQLNNDVFLDKPIDQIKTYRDFYAFERHVKKGFEKRHEPVPEAWYEIPTYYKGPSHSFQGPLTEIPWPNYTQKLDYELELGFVIAREGRNIKANEAKKHLLGFTVFNDVSARDIQKKEMSIRLGPAKGKDFCSIIGPVITTIDEFKTDTPDLLMTAKINGQEWSRGRSSELHYSIGEMIEHASREEWLLPCDFMGTGTVGSGCGLELDKWIQPNDLIELEIEKIGILKNKVGYPRASL